MTPRKAFRQGVLSNLGNPKMAIFYSSLLPQFVAPGSSPFAVMLVLGLVFVSMTLVWLSIYAAVVARAGHILRAAGQASLRCGHGHDSLGVRGASGNRSALTHLVARQAARPSE